MDEQTFVEQAHLIEAGPPVHQTEHRNIVVNKQTLSIELIGVGPVTTQYRRLGSRFLFGDTPGIGVGHLMGATFEKGDERAQVIGQEAVIVIEIGDVGPGGMAKTGVARPCQSPVAVMIHKRRSSGTVHLSDNGFDRSRAVIDHDHFEILVLLRVETLQGHAQAVRPVIGRHNHRHHRSSCKRHRVRPRRRRATAGPDLINGHECLGSIVMGGGRREIPEGRHFDRNAFQPQMMKATVGQ